MKTFADLSLPKAGMSRAREWLAGTRARPIDGGREWRFPSGASITFGYLDHVGDEQRYRTAEFQYIAFDELTRFPEQAYRFMFSRLRRLKGSDLPIRMRAGTNPGDKGHEWVKKRFIPDAFLKARGDQRFERTWWKDGRLYVPARLEDNEHLDQEDYEQSLRELLPAVRRQMRQGDWEAFEGGRFQADWWRRYARRGDYLILGDRQYHLSKLLRFGTCDPAASAKETAASADPDPTVVCAWAVTPLIELVWLDCRRFWKEIPDILPEVQKVYDEWLLSYMAIEAVAANRAIYQLGRRSRMAVKELTPMGLDKLVRATKAIVLAESGRVYLPQWAPWLDEAESEVVRFTGDDKKDAHDDIVDNLSYAAMQITTKEDEKQFGFKPYVQARR